jgi:hypothetical protein
MSSIIHSQAGQLASQRHRSQSLQQSLQDELAVSQERIAKQEREILGLKKLVDSTLNLAGFAWSCVAFARIDLMCLQVTWP